MSLSNQLAEIKAQSGTRIPAEVRSVMHAETERLLASGLTEQAPKVGETLKDFELTNQNGVPTRLATLLQKGPVVITFYRGGWCPYCNLELRAYQQILDQITALNATLVAITPELPDSSLSTAEKNGLGFEVLTDKNSEYGKEIGIVFTLSDELRTIYGNFGIKLDEHNGTGQYSLPCPATFVVDTDGTIAYAYVDVDYTVRAEPAEALAALKAIAK